MTPTACPYCNALAGSELRDGRVVCKRCGEGWAGGPSPAATTPESPVGASPRRVHPLLIVLILMVIGGVALSLWRPWDRPAADPGKPASSNAVTKPTEVAGLGYLPDSTEAVLVVQVPAFLESLGPQADKDPAKALATLGLPESVVRMIDGMSVVGLPEVEQLVLGLGFSHVPPRSVLVLRTRNPVNPDELDRRTKSREQERDGRALHATKGGPLGGDVYWWAANERTLVVTTLARDFDDVPKQPRPGSAHLKPRLRNLIETQVAETAAAWMVADSDSWDAVVKPYTFLPLTAFTGRTDLQEPAARLRSWALFVPADSSEKVEMTVSLKTVEAGDGLRKTWADRYSGEPVEVGGEAEVVRLRVAREPGLVGWVFGRLIGPKP
jgi:hypothetical protein